MTETTIRWHDLKTWPEHWDAVFNQIKMFDVRRDDRSFAVGDGLCLQEWDPNTGAYTGRQCFRIVRHLLKGGQFGIESGYVVMGIS
jgi:hypothetical protein